MEGRTDGRTDRRTDNVPQITVPCLPMSTEKYFLKGAIINEVLPPAVTVLTSHIHQHGQTLSYNDNMIPKNFTKAYGIQTDNIS